MRDCRLDNYELLYEISNKGSLIVFVAEHIHLGMRAVIKALYTGDIPDGHYRRAAVERFHGEGFYLSQADCANIVKLYDYRVEDDVHYIVMELAPGGSLARLHPVGSRLPFWRVRGYARHCGRALQYLHDAGLLHRDVKPGNLFLGSKNRILLGDFGLVMESRGKEESLCKPVGGGTYAYMAPEQARGYPCEASDQYALATMLFEWLTGYSPFEGGGNQILWQRQHCQVPSLRALEPGIPTAVEKVVMRGLEPSPANRYASVLEFVNTFESSFDAAPTRRSAASRPTTRAKAHRSTRISVAQA